VFDLIIFFAIFTFKTGVHEISNPSVISNLDIFDIGTHFSDHTSNLKKISNTFLNLMAGTSLLSLTCKRAIVAGGSVVLVGAVGIFFKTNVTHS
jgi:hypothetical protein